MPDVNIAATESEPFFPHIKAVLFDTFGTVVDWRSGVAREAGSFIAKHKLTVAPEAFADRWRGRYQPSMERIRSGQRSYVPLDTLHRENLIDLLGELAPGIIWREEEVD